MPYEVKVSPYAPTDWLYSDGFRFWAGLCASDSGKVLMNKSIAASAAGVTRTEALDNLEKIVSHPDFTIKMLRDDMVKAIEEARLIEMGEVQ